MKTIELEIVGMTCENCVKHVTQALAALRGVKRVDVSLEEGRATVETQSPVHLEHLIETVEEAGYQARAAEPRQE
jgi:copper chaperone CopZ